MPPIPKTLRILLLVGLAFAAYLPDAAAKHDSTMVAPTIKEESGGLGMSLEPVIFEHSIYLFTSYGFSRYVSTRAVESGCLFSIQIGNDSAEVDSPAVEVDLSLWRVKTNKKWETLKQESWLLELGQLEHNSLAPVVLRWKLLPANLLFGSKDYFSGFIAFVLPLGQPFSLQVHWDYGTSHHTITIPGLHCPERSLALPLN